MVCWLVDDRHPQLEEIVSNFEITNKRIFSAAGRMFNPDICHLPDKIFEALMFISCNKDFKHWLFLFNQCFNVFVALEYRLTNGREEGQFHSPGQLAKCKNQAPT